MKKVLSVIFMAMVFTVIAIPTVSANDWQWSDGYRTVTIIYPDVNFQFYLDGDRIDPNSSCENRFDIWREDVNYEAKVASLLTAFQNGFKVKVLFDNDDVGCNTDVSRFRVKVE